VILEKTFAELVAGDKVRIVYRGRSLGSNGKYYSDFEAWCLNPGEDWDAMNNDTLQGMKAPAVKHNDEQENNSVSIKEYLDKLPESSADKPAASTLGNEMKAAEEITDEDIIDDAIPY
jgi:hypothetical protein